MEKEKLYKILITPFDKSQEPYVLEISTKDLEWSMIQYQRNRDGFDWKIIE